MRLAIGVGCKSDATTEAILRVVEAALARVEDASSPSLRAQRSHPAVTDCGPWMASSQGLLAVTDRDSATPNGLFSHERKADHPGLAAAAAALGLPLRLFTEAELKACEPRLVSRSPRVAALAGVGSVAEAAALLGAGETARLVVAKISAEGVSCAIAEGVPA